MICLTACTMPAGRQIVKTEYVRQHVPALPEKPVYYPVAWVKRDGYYCLDQDSTKNLLKNRALDKGYQGELAGILEDLKEK